MDELKEEKMNGGTGGSTEAQGGALHLLSSETSLGMPEFALLLVPTNCLTKCLKDVVLFAALGDPEYLPYIVGLNLMSM
ncbi:unnamed protein product [Prunus armeniaca]